MNDNIDEIVKGCKSLHEVGLKLNEYFSRLDSAKATPIDMTFTWGEILSNDCFKRINATQEGISEYDLGSGDYWPLTGVYTIKDSVGVPVYIGKSRSIISRLYQHWNDSFMGNPSVKEYLRENHPDSLRWEIDVSHLGYSRIGEMWQAETAESKMIYSTNPYFNIVDRNPDVEGITPTPRPSALDRVLQRPTP